MDSDSSHSLEVTIEAEQWLAVVTEPDKICRRAMRAALQGGNSGAGPLAISLVLSDDSRVEALNAQWRGQQRPTNVLSFPAGTSGFPLPPNEPRPLGDVIVAVETVCREAEAEGKPIVDHLAHLVVHGTLHLLGHDHTDTREAEQMEALERHVLAGLGVPDPYAEVTSP